MCTSTCIWSGNPVHAPIITSPSPAWQQASRASTSTGEVLSAFEQSIPLSPLGVSLPVRPRGSTQFSRAVRIQSRHKEPGTSMDRTGPRRLSRSVVVPPLIAADRERGIETTGSSQRLACRTFSPPTSHVSSLRREYGQTACRQWSARSAQPWRSRTDSPFHVKPQAHVSRAALLQAAAITALATRTAFRRPTRYQHPRSSSVQTRPTGGEKRHSPEVTLSPVVEV